MSHRGSPHKSSLCVNEVYKTLSIVSSNPSFFTPHSLFQAAFNNFIMNPYGQAEWASTGSSSQYPTLSPSIYGALPGSGSGPSSPNDFLLTFHFAYNPTITNCTVTGPNNRTYFSIIDNNPATGFTLFQNGEGKSTAIIEWRRAPGTIVEIRNIVEKQPVSTWLALSADKT